MAKFVVLVVILSIMTGCSSGLGEKSIVDDSEEVDVVEDAGVNTTLATELNLDNESDKSFDQINDELSLLNDNLHNLIESIDDANKLAENVVDNNRMALKEELENLLLEQKMLEDKMDDFYYDIDVINELDKYKSWDANIYNENLTESMTKLNELRDSRNTLKDDIDNFTIKEVHVNSVEELISEISSNKHIILEEGVYTIDEDLFTKDIFLGIPVDSTFMIEEIGNLTIEGEAGKEITISTEVDMGYFITIRDCYNDQISNINFKVEPDSQTYNSVLFVYNSQYIDITDCIIDSEERSIYARYNKNLRVSDISVPISNTKEPYLFANIDFDVKILNDYTEEK